ncbi:hypothetical protein ACWD8I_12290, partial [Micromonospora arida]
MGANSAHPHRSSGRLSALSVRSVTVAPGTATAPGILPVRVYRRVVVVAAAAGPLTPVVGLLPSAPWRLRATGLTAVAAVHATAGTATAAALRTATATGRG